MIGTQLGPYRIDEKLGQGGMGVVYKGYDTTLQRPVAIKTIVASHKEALGSSSEARFMREARAAGRLQHPAVVAIYNFGVEGDTQYIVMEFVEGKSLRKLINDEPLPLEKVYDLGIQTADALAAAHEANIIHRDMKADNIMVTTRGQVKILDFGLAKLKDPVVSGSDGQTAFVTQPGIALGTVSHMSPEQAMGKEVDGKTDVFSLGVVLYHMATGRLPFEGANPTVTMLKILEGEPDRVRQHNPYVPEGLEELIHRCLRKPSVERPTAAEVAERLKQLQAGVDLGAAAEAVRAPAAPRPPAPAPIASGARSAPVPQSGGVAVREMSPIPGTVAAAAAPAPAPVAAAPAARVAPARVTAPPSKTPYRTVRAIRMTVSIGCALLAAALALYFVAAAQPDLRRTLTSAGVYAPLKAVLAPLAGMLHDLSPWKLTNGPWDFATLAIAFVALVARGFIVNWLYTLEERMRGGARR